MALSKCKECGSSVSTLAKSCPKCGAPDPTTKEISSKKKAETKSDNSIIKVLATIGLLIVIFLILKAVFGVGKIGVNKVKKSFTKEKNIPKKFNKVINFTCEGNVILTGIGPDSKTTGFIDEYTLRIVNGKADSLYMTSNNSSSRTSPSFPSNKELIVTPMTIQIYHYNYAAHDDIQVTSYKASISLNTGNYSAITSARYKEYRPSHNFSGRCFGINEISKYIK